MDEDELHDKALALFRKRAQRFIGRRVDAAFIEEFNKLQRETVAEVYGCDPEEAEIGTMKIRSKR